MWFIRKSVMSRPFCQTRVTNDYVYENHFNIESYCCNTAVICIILHRKREGRRKRQKKRKTIIFLSSLCLTGSILVCNNGFWAWGCLKTLTQSAHIRMTHSFTSCLIRVTQKASVCGLLYLVKLWLRPFEKSSTWWWR